MTTTGASNRRKGAETERAVANWLRANGFPGAERAVRTGYRTAYRLSPDLGDITGTPGVVWQVKAVKREDITEWMAETELQRCFANADIGVLVQRREWKADPGQWWAWVRLWVLAGDVARRVGLGGEPVRMELRRLVPVLRVMGYGDAPEEVAW